MSNDITSRLGSYNPPDRTVGAQRQMAQDIADAADALDAKDAEIERLTQELAEAELRTVCNRLQAERDGLRSRLADAFACLQAIRRASWLTPEPRARVEMEIDYRKLRDALNAVAEEKP